MGKLSRNANCWCGKNIKYKKCCWPEPAPLTQFIIRDSPKNSHGTQPIKVLENNILHFFENTNKYFFKQLQNDVNNLELKSGVKYVNEEAKITDLAYINANKQIFLYETYLSYTWILIYSLTTIFDEHILLPRRNKNIDLNKEKIAAKFEFLKYGLSLKERFSSWDIDKFPNPQKYHINDKHNVEKTNSVFLHAINFVMCHEYSHFSLGHTDQSTELMFEGKKVTDVQNKEGEIEADYNSIKLMLAQPKTKQYRKNVEYGIIAGMCSLMFLDKVGKKDSYPDPEIRLQIALEQLQLKDEDLHWGLASLALKLWIDRQKITFELPEIIDTYKDLFYLIIKEIGREKE